ncbi:MAG: LegC family aminotransferase [Prevotella sp.]|nr:LegC family aminotransferase [Bacteroides sp.]MCM1366306.1 LegC family aminotransferase [Prevotella sp.]MCM1437110.1 LegC family aminotransferase [Prevotella sp.]
METKKIIEFIRDIYRDDKFVPLHAPLFAGNEKKYLEECIDTTFVSSVGKFVDRFEQMMTDYTGTAKSVVCVNGTNALQISLLLGGVRRGDEVITQSVSFIATCNAISYLGAFPVFVDVDRETLGMSPEALRIWLDENTEQNDKGECMDKITGRRISACVPMHTFGHPVKIKEIASICKEHGIALIEDAAESIGSEYEGQHTGTFGEIGAISFNGNKTITTGGGGMMLFRDAELGEKAKHLTTQAKVPHRWEFVHDSIGYNFRMPNINAALGCAQMENLDRYISVKRETAMRYSQFFENIDGVEFVTEPAGARSNYWLNAIILPDRKCRDEFLTETNDNGVMTRPIWELMHRLPMFESCRRGDLRMSEWLADRVVNIPSSVCLPMFEKTYSE